MARKKAVDINESLTSLPMVALDQFTDFQGTLKVLTDESYTRLRESVLKHGVSFPIFVWRQEMKSGKVRHYVIDGHQRLVVLRGLQKEGYEVPEKLPVVLISAKSRKEAKEKLLLVVSQYGHLSIPGLESFMEDAKLSLPNLKDMIQLPELNLGELDVDIDLTPFLANIPEVTQTGDEEQRMIVCPHCGQEFAL